MEQLQVRIEKVRLSLYKIAEERSLTDPEVVRISQCLDNLLNEYQQIAS
ncbi:aspartyl-phosphate phosphatase Spo0E family protein [Desulfitobacterium metallireducens]|nr:aspartyl-phosphate phosphatase Spo0E family protein [Desulfitobacterium metallireducens]